MSAYFNILKFMFCLAIKFFSVARSIETFKYGIICKIYLCDFVA